MMLADDQFRSTSSPSSSLVMERVDILGVKIDLVDYDKTLACIEASVSEGKKSRYICACPVHPIVVAQNDAAVKWALNNSFLTVPDGLPVVWAARLLGKRIKRNVRGTELMLRCCALAEKNGYRIFLCGGRPSTLDRLKSNLLTQFPKLSISGMLSPPFGQPSLDEEEEILKTIHSARPDILFVALGAPKQELWMAKCCPDIHVPVSIGVGAAFDFLSGEKRQAPSGMQEKGLEWLFRLCQEPFRLFSRYLTANPVFIFLISRQAISHKFRRLRKRPIKVRVE